MDIIMSVTPGELEDLISIVDYIWDKSIFKPEKESDVLALRNKLRQIYHREIHGVN